MEAYQVRYGTKVIIVDEEIKQPPGSIQLKKGDEITIFRPDGMYCNGIDKDENLIYIHVLTEVDIKS